MIQTTPRFVIVGFDGLRPAEANEREMPELSRFFEEAHVWTRYLAQFPTETYVNHPGIFSGFRPNRHGVIANTYYRANLVGADALFRGSKVDVVLKHDAEDDGIYQVPSMGERLAERGMALRVICANSLGSTRLQHVRADRFEGHLCAPVHDLSRTVPERERERLAARHGTGVPLEFPDFNGTKLTVDLFFEEVETGLGDVTVVWIGEPDHSSHEFGVNDEKTIAARRQADDEFGRILKWWEEAGRTEGVQLIVLSDHGHGVVRRHVDLKAIVAASGLSVVTGAEIVEGANAADYDIVMVGTYTTGLWLKNPTRENLLRVRDALMASSEIGLVFSQPDERRPEAVEGRIPGTFSEALVFTENRRSPHIRFVPRGCPETGELVMAEELEIGTGNHGGLLPQELGCVFAAAGSCFPGAGRHAEPASHEDVAVTIMTKLGVLDDEAMLPLPTGRLLVEGGSLECAAQGTTVLEKLTLRCGGFVQTIEREDYMGRAYLCSGYRENDDGWTAADGVPSSDSTK